MKLMNILLENEGSNELKAIKAKLEADPKNKHLTFNLESYRDRIRIGGRQADKFDFVLRNEKEDFGSYQLFDVDDDDTGLVVRIIRKK